MIRRARGHVARGPERGVRHREQTVAPSGVNPYLRIHPGLEEVSWVRDVHEHREARDVLHDLRLRADLQHGAAEGAVRERINCGRDRKARMPSADARFSHTSGTMDGIETRQIE